MTESEKQKIIQKLQKYCVYQDRCHQEVRYKLIKLEVYGDDLEEVMSDLVQDKFLDEERFARSYARGKFRMKQWGKVRIKNEFKRREISDYCIRKAMTEIDEEDYISTAQNLVNKFKNKYDQLPDFQKKQKVILAMQRQGYEFSLILEVVG